MILFELNIKSTRRGQAGLEDYKTYPYARNMGFQILKFLGLPLFYSLIFAHIALAQTSKTQGLTQAENDVCASVKHCLDIMERHASDSFDYQVLGEEFIRLGDKGRIALINAVTDKNSKIAQRAAALLNNSDFRFSPNEQRQIATYWRKGYPEDSPNALAPVMLQLYSPLMREAAISTLAHENIARRVASQNLISRGEKFLSEHSMDYSISEFRADPKLFVPLSRGVMQDPTPSLIKLIGAYPPYKSAPILDRLFKSDRNDVVLAAYIALKSQDSDASFQKLIKEIKGLKDTQTDRALKLGTLIAYLNNNRSDEFYSDLALQLMADKALSSAGQIVGLDALMKQDFDFNDKDKIITLPNVQTKASDWRPLLSQVLKQSEKIPSLYFKDLDIKLGSSFDEAVPLFWERIKATSSPHKLTFLDNFQARPVTPALLDVLNNALNDVTDWDVSALAVEILGRGDAVGTAPKLRFMAKSHPIFAVQVNIKAALDSLAGQNFEKRKLYWAQALSAQAPHCAIKAYNFKGDSRQLPFFESTKMAFGYNTNRLALTSVIATDTGWLAGYDFGELSGGLIAYDNVTGEGQLIYGPEAFNLEKNDNFDIPNIIAIVPKKTVILGQTSNTFWAITGLANTETHESYILSVMKKGTQFDIRKHAKLPSTPKAVQKNEDGSLTLGFGEKPDLARIKQYKNDKAKLSELLAYNPPLHLSPSGNITRYCRNKIPSNLEAMP